MALMVGIYFFLPIKQMLLFSKTFDFFLPSLPQGKKGLRIPDIQAALQSSNFCARYGVPHKNKVVQLGYYSGDRRHIFSQIILQQTLISFIFTFLYCFFQLGTNFYGTCFLSNFSCVVCRIGLQYLYANFGYKLLSNGC